MTFAGFLGALRRRLIVVIVCLVAGLGGAILQVHRTPKMYAATATYFVSLPSSGTASDTAIQQNAVDVAQAFLLSFQQLASKRSTAESVASVLGTDVGEVAGHLASSVEAGTFYIDVTATSPNPARAREIADAATQVVTDLVPKIQGTSRNPAGASITDRAELPTAPYQPKPRSTEAFGLLLGLVVGVALVVLLELLDRTINSVSGATALAKAPLLSSIPRRKGSTAVEGVLVEELLEPYRVLRSAVTFLDPDKPPVSFLVTSASPGDGKTTTVLNLAASLAESGRGVLVIDADLRRVRLSRLSGGAGRKGLTAVLTKAATLDEVVYPFAGFSVLSAGERPPNPAELLASLAMAELLETVQIRYDAVLIDAPPLLAVSDALSLAPMADATLLVVSWRKTPRTGLAEARRRLDAAGITPAGYVLNAVPRAESADYYGDYVEFAD